MTAKNLVCKYDPSHGVFRTPVDLGDHYRDEHGDVYVSKRTGYPVKLYRCRLCGRDFRNPSSHIAQKHHAEYLTGRPFVSRYFDRVDADTPSPPQSVDVVRHEPDTAPRHVGPWTVDDIVLPVVEQLAKPSGKVPVSVLAALFVWRDQTAAMLREVTGRNG